MRAHEAGFTLLELVVTVGITAILLAAGGYWMLSTRPGALAGALDDFDANLAAAKAIAASSGNGATIVFAPQANGAPGFTMRVYAGRPTAANAVTVTNTMAEVSNAAVSEATLGNPPFALFVNSAGYINSGQANYPSIASGTPAFTVIATQPPCPSSGGFTLTFTSPTGTGTRTIHCNVVIAGASSPDPTPTPNPLKVEPASLLAHDTTDAGPLQFKAVEYGYYHWIASTRNGDDCQTIASQNGGAPATFASPWPYTSPSPAAQGDASPAPPQLAPYAWPAGDPNDPPAAFQLEPVLHNGGLCSVTVADDYGQTGTVNVQVMGDLTPGATPTPIPVGQTATVNFGKTFDSEKLLLSAGGACLGIVNATTASGSFPASPSNTPATGSVTITAVSQGSCVLLVQDQYGEQVQIPIDVQAVRQNFATWPASLVVGASGGAVGTTTSSGYTGPCYAQAFASGTSGSIDTSLPPSVASALGVSVTTDGCILNADASAPYGGSTPTGVMIAYEPVGSGQTGNFSDNPLGCGGVTFGAWTPPSASGAQVSLPAVGATPGGCSVDFSDGTSTQALAADKGAVAVTTVQSYTFQVLPTGEAYAMENGDVLSSGPYVWMLYAVPAGQSLVFQITCTDYGIISAGPPVLHGCLAWGTSLSPSGAQALCQFELGNSSETLSGYGADGSVTDAYFWSYFDSGTTVNQSNSLGYSCADLVTGSAYPIGSVEETE
ncbi:MAG TPA: prepilin-type N-terminal cleavage/methylation domain-containing protein [Candidatus Acidoferrales bacterium]|nr:prepilin-type N-terminal cleavage/methylation domain-containing protein [Candidatus Acidoferrales bacterium]